MVKYWVMCDHEIVGYGDIERAREVVASLEEEGEEVKIIIGFEVKSLTDEAWG
jgi:predicted glycosyltransferase